MPEDNDERGDVTPVGYGSPPRHSRFKAGQSGNPSGRPKGVRSLTSDLADELAEQVQVSENGRTLTLTKQRLAVKAITAKAIKGHVPALTRLFELMRETQGLGDEFKSDGSGRLDEQDEAVIASLFARMDEAPSSG